MQVNDLTNTPAVEIAHTIVESVENINKHARLCSLDEGSRFTEREARDVMWPRFCEYFDIKDGHYECFCNAFNAWAASCMALFNAQDVKSVAHLTFWTAFVLDFIEYHKEYITIRS